MAKTDRFEETKIKLMMKVRKISRSEATAEIARMEEERRHGRTRTVGSHSGAVNPSAALVPHDDIDLLSAEDFFGE